MKRWFERREPVLRANEDDQRDTKGAGRIEAMDLEQTKQFLREQQAAFEARMGELRTLLEQIAVNQVEIDKGQVRFDANMRELRNRAKRSRQRLKRSDQRKAAKTEAMLQALIERIDRLVEILNGRFGANASVA